jgi:fluoride exporter
MQLTLASAFVVFVGGGLGAVARFALMQVIQARWNSGFPWSTMVVNVGGSMLAGLIVGWNWSITSDSSQWRLFLLVGLLGGFTTFSAFSVDVIKLFDAGRVGLALGYVLLSVMLSVAVAMLGFNLTR